MEKYSLFDLLSYYSVTVVRSCENAGIPWLKYVYDVCKKKKLINWKRQETIKHKAKHKN